jgi:3-hexulose-6-phosphate synthase
VKQVVDAGADIVVAGAAIYGAADPAAAAAEITGLAREAGGGAGADGIKKFLPWILVVAAVLIGLSLMKNKPADPAASAAAPTEEAAPAADAAPPADDTAK